MDNKKRFAKFFKSRVKIVSEEENMQLKAKAKSKFCVCFSCVQVFMGEFPALKMIRMRATGVCLDGDEE